MSDLRASCVNDLKGFRLVKPSIMRNGEPNPSSAIVPGRKRIKVIEDSDSDIDMPTTTVKKTKMELTVKEKEQRFISAAKIAPGYDPMHLQNSLLRCEWDVSRAIKHLKENYPKRGSSSNEKQLNGTHKKEHYRHSDDSDNSLQQTSQVYDSDDDSDLEVSDVMTTDKKSVFEFLNKASVHELLSVKSCSEKKATAIIEMRPFESWSELVTKLNNHKMLSGDLLNNCQDLITKRNNVAFIMNKCNKLVEKLETAIETGAGITHQPTILNRSMKLAEYQMVGLNWLTVMHQEGMNGILADEMGLGKTIQVIAFLAYLQENHLSKAPHLIVVPASTLDNWEAELHKWCPTLSVEKYYGNQDERRMLRYKYSKEGFEGIDIILTTYSLVGSAPEERKLFRVTKLHYVVFDEAHMLKNMTTQRYAQLITINAARRILLTGTPLQNNLLELMSLLCFVMPSVFGKNTEDIKALFQKKYQKVDESKATTFEQNQIQQAKRIMKPFVLRRLKKDVLKYLPKKTEHILKVPMSEDQKDHYQELVQYYSNDKGFVGGSADMAGSTMMMDMRKLANHPLLMRYYYSDRVVKKISEKLSINPMYKKDNPDYIFEELACMSDFQIWQLCEKFKIPGMDIPDELIVDSGKFKKLDALLPKLKSEGHRTLIFSQFTMMLDIVERYCDIRQYPYCRLDGSTQVTERKELIDLFNENSDIFLFLLSTKAGGMGINLTSADTAIIHDIDFNPYNDKQAEDRCHRMGQTKPVTIYRFISEGTIEEGMLLVAEEKLRLEKEIHGDDVQEHKCMVRLLTMALGTSEKRAEELLSPQKLSASGSKSIKDS